QWVAERRGHVRPSTEQPPYSILARGVEASVLPTCERYGLGVLVWAPLNGGWLTGKYRDGRPPPLSRADREPDHFHFGGDAGERKMGIVEEVAKIADEAGISLVDLAHAFVLAHRAVTSAIIGPRTMEQLDDVLASTDTVLSSDVMDRIDEVVAPGTTLNASDAGWVPPALERSAL